MDKVYYWPEFDNLAIISAPTIFMFATFEGSTGRKMCCDEEHLVRTHGLVYIGEL